MSSSPQRMAVVTGGNSGIGKWTAIELAKQGFGVVITSRDAARGAAAVEEIRDHAQGSTHIECLPLDLASFASIRGFVATLRERCDQLDVLVNNAGLILSQRGETEQGFESMFGVNHLGHFLLTQELLSQLEAADRARIVVLASHAHKAARKGLNFEDLQSLKGYQSVDVYAKSKLANIYFVRELARRLKAQASDIVVNAVHPGVVASGFARDGDAKGVVGLFFNLGRPFFLSAQDGARTSVFVASSPSLAGKSGGYYAKCKLTKPSKAAQNDDAARRLWQVSEQMVASAG